MTAELARKGAERAGMEAVMSASPLPFFDWAMGKGQECTAMASRDQTQGTKSLHHSNSLWANPRALATALTRNPEGQAYLQRVLPELRHSPTGRAVVEALLLHAPVAVRIIPEWLRSILRMSLQPWGSVIYMHDANQPAATFAHEAVHLIGRASGVEPSTFLPRIRPSWQPGFSLQMEREAYVVQWTIELELEASKPSSARSEEKLAHLSNRILSLTTRSDEAALDLVRSLDADGDGKADYAWFPRGSEPPRDWRADLRRMGLGEVVPFVERARQHGHQAPSAGGQS